MSDNTTPVVLTKDELRNVVKDGVKEAFLQLGVRTDSPEAVVDMQKDFQHLREWRVSADVIKKKGIVAVVGVLVTGGCAALWMGIKHMVNGT